MFSQWFKKILSIFKRNDNQDYSTKNNSRKKKIDDEYLELKVQNEKRVDEILAKISKKGVESLSKSEKVFLNSQRKNN